MITLALYPNARGFGYAVIQSPCEFYDYGVAHVRPISNQKCIKRIKKLINRYTPTNIIIQKLEGKNSHKTKRVTSLLQDIVQLAKDLNLNLFQYTREQIRFVFSEYGAKSKYEIACLITDWFKEDLEDYVPTYRKPWMCEYHTQGLYDAVSLYLVWWYLTE